MGGATSHTRKDYQILVELDNVLSDIGVLEHYNHARWFVYPQDVRLNVQLQAAAVANTFGNWAKIVPENTIPFKFQIVGIVVEEINATTTYHIQLGHNPGASEPGENMELGERRMRFAVSPASKVTELLEIRSQDMTAYSSVWGRIKTAAGPARPWI